MVAVLIRIFGAENLETAEDVVQQSFMDALHVWKLKGVPDNPSAWLFRVAKNKTIDVIRRNKHSVRFNFNETEWPLLVSGYTMSAAVTNLWEKGSINDDMLRMMFACCHPEISAENQITLMLKTLCGFSTAEIAKALLTSEDTISKRLYRTKEFFRREKIKFEMPSGQAVKERTNTVLNAIYLLFNEGYSSTHSDTVIRDNLIQEAMMLGKLLAENKDTGLPQVYALMALMCFHAARAEGRLTAEGEIILLERQDRNKWNGQWIEEGNMYMNKAAFGNTISSYHIEAAIAYEHCIAESFETTNWVQILKLYDWLCNLSPSCIAEMNRTVVILNLYGPDKALQSLESIREKDKLESFYLYHSLLGEIYARLRNTDKANCHFQKAIELTQSAWEKKLLEEKRRGCIA
jgi:RNA polymerase sigma-70 factor (ECF subfamily)